VAAALLVGLMAVAAVAPTSSEAQAAQSFKVRARIGWQQTPLNVSKGSEYSVAYKIGDWTVDYRNFEYVGPKGYPPSIDSQIYQGCKLNSNWPYARLLGKVGKNGSLFSVGGNSFSNLGDVRTFTASTNGSLYLRIHDADSCLGDNGGSITVNLSTGKEPGTGDSKSQALLAPVNNGVKLTVIHGYNDPPYEKQNPEVCSIATKRDHCANQQFGLDLTPGSGWDNKILAPVPGTPKEFVYGAGGPCLLFTLDDGLNLNICHFAKENTELLGKHVARGTVLGTAATSWIHLSLDARPKQCTGGWTFSNKKSSYPCPIEFVSPHTLEGKPLPSDGSVNQWKNTSFVSSNNELP